MFEVATIYIRSIVGIVALTSATCFLAPTDPTIIGAFYASVVAMVMLDKGAPGGS